MFEAVVLAFIQGLATFLPVSALVHRRVLSVFLGSDEPGLALTAGLELGSLIAVVLFFGSDWVQIIANAFGWQAGRDPELRRMRGMLGLLIAASLPIAATGYFLQPMADTTFRSPWLAGVMLMVVGLAMGWAESSPGRQKSIDHMSLADAMLIGLVQSLAVVPGASRMALALTAALMLNFERAASVRISYLLALPVLAGRGGLLARELVNASVAGDGFPEAAVFPFAISALVTAVTGIATMALFSEYVGQASLKPFARYRVGFGVLVLGLAAVL